jgi:hypothetical protein
MERELYYPSTKYRHISPDKLLDFLSARYLIEINEGIVDRDSNTYSWRYLHGIENTKIKEKSIDDIEYVYMSWLIPVILRFG